MTSEFKDRFDAISPLDSRYWDPELAAIFSERAFLQYKLAVEVALTKALNGRGICPAEALAEIEAACDRVTPEEVTSEKKRIGHDIRAIVNCIRAKVSDDAKRFVHLTATSYDIVDTANALRYRDSAGLLFNCLRELQEKLIQIAESEAETLQIGRTHGQHAMPITFGFAIANYVSRIGRATESVWKYVAQNALPGKFSGAVGAYNATSLFSGDPEAFELEVLNAITGGPGPAEISTQIVPPDHLARFLSETVIAAGIMANLADDLRHLQRTEIGEVGEAMSGDQVGSSTMPQKKNPITFENVKSMFKIVSGRMGTVYADLISEHQRDLSGSASGRAAVEIVGYAVIMAKRMTKAMKNLRVNEQAMERNLAMSRGLIAAEPLYLTLAALGHPDAHEAVRKLVLAAERKSAPLTETAATNQEIAPYFERMSERQLAAVSGKAADYSGIAAKKARSIAKRWRVHLA